MHEGSVADPYLERLLLRHFLKYQTRFARDAGAYFVAPDNVLSSRLEHSMRRFTAHLYGDTSRFLSHVGAVY